MTAPPDVRDRLRQVRLLVTDVDGVLTDGRLHYGPAGEERKVFHVRDGLGIRMLLEHGVAVAVITARTSEALSRRMRELLVEHVLDGCEDKGRALDELVARLGLDATEVAFVGDDLVDLAALRRAGVAITVADGHALVKDEVHWVTRASGGAGALREVADAILEAKGLLALARDQVTGEETLDRTRPER